MSLASPFNSFPFPFPFFSSFLASQFFPSDFHPSAVTQSPFRRSFHSIPVPSRHPHPFSSPGITGFPFPKSLSPLSSPKGRSRGEREDWVSVGASRYEEEENRRGEVGFFPFARGGGCSCTSSCPPTEEALLGLAPSTAATVPATGGVP